MRRGAFTLVEMLLVVVIIGILAAIVVPHIAGRAEQARETAAKADIASFSTALGIYDVDNGSYPRGRSGLQSLVQRPNNTPGWHGPYLEGKTSVPLDPWGNAYVYECPGKHNPTGFDLSSLGPPDGSMKGNNAICNWQAQK